jgi:hypothetical protein
MENPVLGLFIVVPLLIVMLLFSDRLWQRKTSEHTRFGHRRQAGWRYLIRAIRHPD